MRKNGQKSRKKTRALKIREEIISEGELHFFKSMRC
jgi:hypothetical protein